MLWATHVWVLESHQASKIKENFCNDDRHSAGKLARVYLSGLAQIVWQPVEQTRVSGGLKMS